MTVEAIGALGPGGASGATATVYDQMVAGLGAAQNTSIENIAVPGLDSGIAAEQRGQSFAAMVGQGLQSVENLDVSAQNKAIGAATGDLEDVHDYVIAAVEAQTAVELTTTLRNKALESFQQIMGMPL